MAIAILSIPKVSRARASLLWSNSWDRLRLKPQKMEVIESLGSWLREGLIKPNCLNSMGLSTEAVTGDENEAEQNASDDEMEISTFLELVPPSLRLPPRLWTSVNAQIARSSRGWKLASGRTYFAHSPTVRVRPGVRCQAIVV